MPGARHLFSASHPLPGAEFCFRTQHLPGRGGEWGGLAPPPLPDPNFTVGKNEISQKEVLIWLFLVHKLLDFWVPGPPPPPLRRTLPRGGGSAFF